MPSDAAPFRVGRSRLAAAAILALAGACWWLSVGRMRGMDAGPSAEVGAAGWFIVTWLLMMAAMMLPAVAPLVALPRPPAGRVAFVASYLAVWVLVGAGAYLLLRVGRDVAGGVLAWHRGGRWLAVLVVLAAAAYQLTPAKRRCLAHCRDAAASSNGLRAGGWCLASSWALMATLFALGAMSLWWMAGVAALIAVERLASLTSAARLGVAAVLVALAAGVAVAPASVPGLTVPGSPAAERAMMMMSGPAMHPGMPMRP
jgi:predicted metal-binding membrane protein